MGDSLTWYRSWPAPHEWAQNDLDKRPHVIDSLPRIVMQDHNYQRVLWPDHEPGFCMLEWDVALDPIARRLFAAQALIHPREVLVASYRFHDTEIAWQGNPGDGPNETSWPIRSGCPMCGEIHTDSFGFGCIYFPRWAVNDFLLQMDHTGFTDATFGLWYRERFGRARVCWAAHPQHLHEYEDVTV